MLASGGASMYNGDDGVRVKIEPADAEEQPSSTDDDVLFDIASSLQMIYEPIVDCEIMEVGATLGAVADYGLNTTENGFSAVENGSLETLSITNTGLGVQKLTNLDTLAGLGDEEQGRMEYLTLGNGPNPMIPYRDVENGVDPAGHALPMSSDLQPINAINNADEHGRRRTQEQSRMEYYTEENHPNPMIPYRDVENGVDPAGHALPMSSNLQPMNATNIANGVGNGMQRVTPKTRKSLRKFVVRPRPTSSPVPSLVPLRQFRGENSSFSSIYDE